MTGIYLLLGSNLGDKQANLVTACDNIEQTIGDIIRKSSIYTTEPWGMEQAPVFVNQVLHITTRLSPKDLMTKILNIESGMGRIRNTGYQNRTIDIDILYYNDHTCETPRLTIPHPRIGERRFVLEPLLELAAELVHPVSKLTTQELLDRCKDQLSVKKVEEDQL